jgi:hypothetical protein
MGKADADREGKGRSTCQEPGVRPMACEDRTMKREPETPASPQGRENFLTTLRLWSAVYKLDDTGKRRSWMFGESEWPESDDGRDNTTRPERGAMLPSCVMRYEDCMSADMAMNMRERSQISTYAVP